MKNKKLEKLNNANAKNVELVKGGGYHASNVRATYLGGGKYKPDPDFAWTAKVY